MKYWLSWVWLHGNFPPKGWTDHWLLKHVGETIRYEEVKEENITYRRAVNGPAFIPASDTQRNGWFGLKRKLYKERKQDND